MLSGHSTMDALRILAAELHDQLTVHESRVVRRRPLRRLMREGACTAGLLRGEGNAVVVLGAALLLVAFSAQTQRCVLW